MSSPKLNLSTTAWEELVDFLIDRGVLEGPDDIRPGYTGRGQRQHGIAFVLPDDIGAVMRFAAALADAFNGLDSLIDLAADGFAIDDLLRNAYQDNMGLSTIIYFPGHTAQAL